MFNDRYFWISLKNNGLIMAVSVFGQIPLGFLFAYVIHRKLVKFGDFFQTIIYLPCVISTIIVGRLWQSFFSPYGPFTEFMQKLQPGWENELFFDPQLAILPVLFVILWMYTGTYMIIFLANLQKATEWQVLVRIMLPALSGVIVTACILAISGSLKSFDLLYAMTGGNPARRTSVLALYMYDTAFRHSPNYPLANAISVVMVLLSFAIILMVRFTEAKFGGRE
jgi:raffinose/stachyose/melibiose transport system permease protein